jgi:galactose mutarotase-like enzyme
LCSTPGRSPFRTVVDTVHAMTTMDVFGQLSDGRSVHCLALGAAPGPVLHLLDLGATVHRLEVTCGDGVRRNVVLGHRSPEEYLSSTDYLGASIGRYANRIAGGTFPLDGREVTVGVHDRGNHLHGGPDGFDRRLWEVVERTPDRAVLRLESPDGDQGFPGHLIVQVTYEVTGAEVRVAFEATTDAPTVVNLTNHSYFNLDGEGSGTVDQHRLTVLADEYTPVDPTGIPLSGAHAPVDGTPFDLRSAAVLGPRARAAHEQVMDARGIDHNYVLRGTGRRNVAVLESPRSRTRLELTTDQPGLQVYTGNFLDGTSGSVEGALYRQGDGIALEPQLFPDSPNRPEFPDPVLRPGETYRAALGWRFGPVTD